MNLGGILAEKRSSISMKWINLIFETYPGDTQKFFSREKDRFANPVGQTIKKEVEHLYDELVKDVLDLVNVSSCLDNIIRIRAVQDFKPSHAVGFILQLKKLIREELESKASINGLSDELRTFESRIDDVALLAFDIYSQCRQRIYELRVNEVKKQVSRLLSRANLLSEIPEQEPDL